MATYSLTAAPGAYTLAGPWAALTVTRGILAVPIDGHGYVGLTMAQFVLAQSPYDNRRPGQISSYGRLLGTVKYYDGTPAPRANVWLSNSISGAFIAYRRAADDGSFEFTGLEIGTSFYYVVATPPPDAPMNLNAQVFWQLVASS